MGCNRSTASAEEPNHLTDSRGMKTAAIILFSIGFAFHVVGALTFFILIGIFFTLVGFLCYVIGFVCLCLI
jgi:hypothetical protein